ncbi:MAG: endopeptidase La [Desulfobacterales bacterium]|nr:endopeptidase La [Desulfobacterales bacterium]
MVDIEQDELIHIIEEKDESDIKTIPNILPLMPIRDVIIFNDMILPLFVGRDKSIQAVEEASLHNHFLLIAAQKDPVVENPELNDIYRIGTVCKILRLLKLPDGRLKALVQGIARAKIINFIKKQSIYRARIKILHEVNLETIDLETEALIRLVKEHSEQMFVIRGEFNADIGSLLSQILDPGKLSNLIASNLKLKNEEAQLILEMDSPLERLKKVNDFLNRELQLSTMQAKIQSDVREEISKTQRDYFLREQVRVIHKELGDYDQEIENYKKKIKLSKMPKVAEQEAYHQLKRIESMHPESSEISMVKTYMDWLVEMPWNKCTKDVLDIVHAKKILNKDHYGLDKVKDRILEYLSVRKLNPQMKGSILCLVGPPGVGKTSLGKAIARTMKRKFVRISLGGIHDEAEIRGHRRTYIGAMPGRILQGLKQCGAKNPVFMMDEIDKIGLDYRGDPAAALLEALDPEQNFEFSDHYLNVPFDLSKVMFILTANQTDTIPLALFDRMEVIYLSGYTDEEKETIANHYLIPRQLKENGLKKKDVIIKTDGLQLIIHEYTSEAGLRNLEREIATIFRKVARRIAEGKKAHIIITPKNVSKYLGPPKFIPEMDKEKGQVGLSTGLAWTYAGGETLFIETSLFPGKGELIVTGQLGEVMQESARAALTYVKANLKRFGIEDEFLENKDVHIHIPAGATPKDGPSAGIAMAVSLISAITGKQVNGDVAMTGEITLRGRVLPIGGLKEKALGALRAEIKTVIFPFKNKKDLEEIPKSVRKKIHFKAVKSMDEVLSICIGKKRENTCH